MLCLFLIVFKAVAGRVLCIVVYVLFVACFCNIIKFVIVSIVGCRRSLLNGNDYTEQWSEIFKAPEPSRVQRNVTASACVS